MSSEAAEAAQHHPFDDYAQRQRSIEVLDAVRAYSAAEAALQRRTQAALGMGETDLLALRYLLRMHRAGHSVGAKELAAYLGISSASTTVLLDRLERSGHLVRQPNPFDRRALIIVPTAASGKAMTRSFDETHERMIRVARDLDPADAATVVAFLTSLRESVDASQLQSIVYSSVAVAALDSDHLAELLTKSRANNARLGLTGMLVHREGHFLQVLEGPSDTIEDRMAVIRADPRHTRLTVLIEEDISVRQFPDWTMGFRPIDDEAVDDIPGYRRTFEDLARDEPGGGSLPALRELLAWYRASVA
ncbi:hypothetical protein B7R21_07800 [Subtercola boreus]|uniref:BLUF domain-containing protein n=1 Tax=Subtercola boreus TaxID=120213 RepID=A0A3E0VWJ0_9MICO|nr:BLUF domain-containing protein [Subtercola boreus]RFA13728.1 hypothetical protein B7R21_07800 [Subtercola boreus]